MRTRSPKQYCLQLYIIYIYIYIYEKLNYGYITFPAFSLARWTEVIISYTCTTKHGQRTHQQIKESWIKIFPSKPTAVGNRVAADLKSRNSGTVPKYKWNSPLHCSECFRMTKTSTIIVIKKFFSQPGENFPCC